MRMELMETAVGAKGTELLSFLYSSALLTFFNEDMINYYLSNK